MVLTTIRAIIAAIPGIVQAATPAAWKGLFVIAVGAFLWGSGYWTALEKAKQLDNERHFAEVDRKNEQLAEFADKLAVAVLERDKARADASRARSDSRALAARLRSAVSGASANPVCQRQLKECRELLAEGVELSGEGEELARQLDADRSAARSVIGR